MVSLGFFNRYVVAFFEASILKEARILRYISTVTVDANTKVRK